MMVSDRLIEFVETFEELLFDSQKKIKLLYDNEYLNNPYNKEAMCQDEDYIYKMRISIVSKKKTYCEDCSCSKNGKCYLGLAYQEKKYCPLYTTQKTCWDCVNYEVYGEEDSYCELDLEYQYDHNYEKKCPEWKFDGI